MPGVQDLERAWSFGPPLQTGCSGRSHGPIAFSWPEYERLRCSGTSGGSWTARTPSKTDLEPSREGFKCSRLHAHTAQHVHVHQGAVAARFVSKLRLTLTQSSSRRPYKGRPRRPSLSSEHGCNRRAAPALRLDGSGLRARPRAGTARPAARKPRPRPRPTLRPRRGGAEQAAPRGSSRPGGRRRHRSSGLPARQGHRLGLRPSGGGAAGLRRPPAASRRFVARASRARGPERCAGGRGWKNKGEKMLGRSCPARWRSRRLAGRALFLREAAVTRWGRFRRECGVEDDPLA